MLSFLRQNPSGFCSSFFCSLILYSGGFLTPFVATAQADALTVPGEAPIETVPGERRETQANARYLAPTYPPSSRFDLPPFSRDEEKKIRALVANKRRYYTGFGRDLSLAAQNWFLVERRDGFDVWQAHVYSPSALHVTAHLSGFGLGEGAFVNVYSLDSRDEYMGTYSGRGPEGNGRFISNIVLGDTIVFEFWSPTESDLTPAGFPFSIDSITHTFRDKDGRLHGLSSDGERRPVQHVADNSSCPVNVSRCADYGMTVGSAVARYIVTAPGGEQVLCTGALLSSAAANSRRLFMTAWHCVEDTVVDSEAGSIPVNAMFTFGDDTCDLQTATARGTRFVAGNRRGDWALLRLDQTPSGDFAPGTLGFLSNRVATGSSIWGIHHATGQDQQRYYEGLVASYSFLENPSVTCSDGSPDCAEFNTFCEGTGCSHYEVDITEGGLTGGASGSPAFVDVQGAMPGFTGLTTHADPDPGTCHPSISIFEKMYEDGRVEGALTYGDDYFTSTGTAANFDDRARPVYAYSDGGSDSSGGGSSSGSSGGGGSATGYTTLLILAGLLLLASFKCGKPPRFPRMRSDVK